MKTRKVLMRRVFIRTRNRITVPQLIMDAPGLSPGDILAWDVRKNGSLVASRARQRAKRA